MIVRFGFDSTILINIEHYFYYKFSYILINHYIKFEGINLYFLNNFIFK